MRRAAAADPPFAGRRAVITGAAGGIGSEIARHLAEQGTLVHGLDQDAAGLSFLARELGPAAFTAHVVDLSDRAAVDRILVGLREKLRGRCNVLVNNAGIAALRSLEKTDDAFLDRIFEVNVTAAIRITRALLPDLRAGGHSSIVNVASELALVGAADYSAYCATKGALLAWTRALAVELGAQGIRVNAVCPGPVDTALLRQEFMTHADPDEARRAEIAAIPLSRLGTARDIAPLVTFLASEDAAFVTGAVWPVDGGKTAR